MWLKMSNGKTLGIAILGYGGMGGFHAKLISSMPELTLCGVYDIDPERNAVAAGNGIHAYGSRDELLTDPNVQVVTVAIPNDQHLAECVDAMKAGKNVVCEKPVCLNSGELQQMIDCSNKNGVLFTVHQNRRWDEDFLTIKKVYDDNMLGNTFNIESRVHGSRGIPGDWRNKKIHGGGMILDWGVHLLDQALMMIDKKLVSVYARISNVTNEEVDDGFTTVLTFEGGLTFTVEVGTSNFINLPRWYIQGENGSAVIQDWKLNGEIVMVSDWENRDAVPIVTAAGLTKTMAPRTEETIKRYPLPAIETDLKDYYRNIKDVVEGKAEQIVKHDEVMAVMRLMEDIFKSAETGQIITY